MGFNDVDQNGFAEEERIRDDRLTHAIMNSNLPPDHPWRKREEARRQPSVPFVPSSRIDNACAPAAPPRPSGSAKVAAEDKQHDANRPAAKEQSFSFVEDAPNDDDSSWSPVYNFHVDQEDDHLENYDCLPTLAQSPAPTDPTGSDAGGNGSNTLVTKPTGEPKDQMGQQQDEKAPQAPGVAFQPGKPKKDLDTAKFVRRHRKLEKRAKKLRQEQEEEVMGLVNEASYAQRELTLTRQYYETTNSIRAEFLALANRWSAAEAGRNRLQSLVENLEAQVAQLKTEARALKHEIEDLKN
ncbi:hypothetical protein GGTG_05546 [Gaeumannomyces tritici R3-111a-1]|uniref:BZIP domain-containing protein n=1 Tax=Gaeumannomyces tritici (strain R3-111a-1) TaxID=644352 RepID=J3NW81_GAET3|nr:hypothetical protein GGTG_05546 [Gaeumannomyces tritici R3-111a-1]EJT75613.1 hypothetical protein GGTG_05546 [Gaeumannomyces tritici R3-111a-1]